MAERKETTFVSNDKSAPKKKQQAKTQSKKMDSETSTLIEQKIDFTGTGEEYFGIWIVNLILSIITLGIYSAWAKVKRETYFKNNTKIADIGFGYHATGKQILKGRLIAIAVLFGINIASSIQPFFGVAMLPIFLFLVPWVLNSSMRFAARMISYRNIRFNWHGTYWKTFWFLVIAPIFGLLTLGLLTPLISKSYYSYFARSHSYGTSRFSCQPKVREYYLAFLVGVILPTILVTFTLLILGGGRSFGGWGILFAAIYAFIFSMAFIYSVLCRNLMMKSLTLSNLADFDSNISPIKFIWISLSNLVAIIISFGLLLPWANIRMYSYISSSTKIKIDGNLEKFVDQANTIQSSFGEAIADFEGIEAII